MSIPLFYADAGNLSGRFELDEATSRHVNQVLRMKTGDHLLLTNGKGKKYAAVINEQNKKGCTVFIESETEVKQTLPHITIAISLLKNASRLEWFLEKATEIGINAIVPLLCERTEKTHFRMDRMRNILVSAMLQSQQSWLPALSEPEVFHTWASGTGGGRKMIAHCLDERKKVLKKANEDTILCIGPEGDFSTAEISLALEQGFDPVTLGENRLRTETAGMVGAALLRI